MKEIKFEAFRADLLNNQESTSQHTLILTRQLGYPEFRVTEDPERWKINLKRECIVC